MVGRPGSSRPTITPPEYQPPWPRTIAAGTPRANPVEDHLGDPIGDVAEPVEGFDEVECGAVAVGGFVEPGRHPAPLLATAKAAFDLVAVAVGDLVERGRSASTLSASLTVGDLIGRLRDDRGDMPAPQRLSVGSR
jgi:hypothetical protein